MKRLIVLAVYVLALSGCAHYQTIGVSSTGIGSQYERPAGIAAGSSTRWYFFPFYAAWPQGDDSLKGAIDNALKGRHGDALANIYAERKTVAFPHIYFPLVLKTEVMVTGTLVKYNTKEFPKDNEEIYSNDVSVFWGNLSKLKSPEQEDLLRSISSDRRGPLVQYALNLEKEKKITEGSADAALFYLLMGRIHGAAFSISNANASGATAKDSASYCQTFNCLLGYSFDEQKLFVSAKKEQAGYVKDTAERADARKILIGVRKDALKRIRACYPEKNPGIVTSPEAQILVDELRLLQYLCSEGFLSE